MVMQNSSIGAWIRHFLACTGGCFGCCSKPTPIIAVDEPSKGLKIQGRMVRKPSISDDFWSTSTYDPDNSTIQSQRSISSISTSNQTPNSGSGIGSTSCNSHFVNHGKFSYVSLSPTYLLRKIWLFLYAAIWRICYLLLAFCSGIKPGFNGLEVAGPGIKLNKVGNPN